MHRYSILNIDFSLSNALIPGENNELFTDIDVCLRHVNTAANDESPASWRTVTLIIILNFRIPLFTS
jgi:hypothetical protein